MYSSYFNCKVESSAGQVFSGSEFEIQGYISIVDFTG
jgi:hypothetical protein